MRDDTSPEGLIPDRQLAEDLRALYGEEIDVPDRVDEAVLDIARRALESRRRRPWILRRPFAAGSVAALLLVGFLGMWASFHLGSPGGAPEPDGSRVAEQNDAVPARAPGPIRTEDIFEDIFEDVDASGRVDIVDALVLARRVADRQPLRAQWDFNRDGRVDRGDADAVAIVAVRLE